MTKLLEQAIEAARLLPPEEQDNIALMILQFAGHEHEPVPLTRDERQAIAKSMAQAERGEFATEEEVRAVWKKHGL